MGPLHHARRARRLLPGRLQQRLPDSPVPRLRAHLLRDDPRGAHHPDRRTAAQGRRICGSGTATRSVAGKGTRWSSTSTNYNGKGWIATNAAAGRIRGVLQSDAAHAVERFTRVERQDDPLRSDDRGSEDVHAPVDGGDSRSSATTPTGSTSTPVTRGITPSRTCCAAPARSRDRAAAADAWCSSSSHRSPSSSSA